MKGRTQNERDAMIRKVNAELPSEIREAEARLNKLLWKAQRNGLLVTIKTSGGMMIYKETGENNVLRIDLKMFTKSERR